MIFQHTWQWIFQPSPHTGKPKTQTRRVRRRERDGTWCKPRYRVGKLYAVQPERCHFAVGRIRITAIRFERPCDISDADVEAEGFASREQFLERYGWTNPGHCDQACIVYEFEAVKAREAHP